MALSDVIKETINEIKGGIAKKLDPATDAGKRFGILGNVASGATKMAAGGIGAVPTAIGKGMEQTPTLIGKAIGAVPANPPDLASNPSAKLAGEGYDEFTKGIGDMASGVRERIGNVRSKAMLKLGLVEASPVTQEASAAQPQSKINTGMDNVFKAPAAQPNPAATVAGKNFGIEPKAEVVAPVAPEAKPEGIKRWVDETGTIHLEGQNLGIKKPEAKIPVSTGDIEKDIGARIEKLSSDPVNRSRSGGLLRSVQNEIGELQRALLTSKVEGKKTEQHAETNRLGRETIAESKKESLAAKKEQAFTNELKAFATKRMNPATGESDLDYTPYLFKVAMTSPDRIPDAFKADADAAMKRFDEYVSAWESHPKSGKAGAKATPEERKGLYELYLNKLSQ